MCLASMPFTDGKSPIIQLESGKAVRLDRFDVAAGASRRLDIMVLVADLDGRRVVHRFQILLCTVTARRRAERVATTVSSAGKREERVDRLDRFDLS